jgi:hypothetical protein
VNVISSHILPLTTGKIADTVTQHLLFVKAFESGGAVNGSITAQVIFRRGTCRKPRPSGVILAFWRSQSPGRR